MGLKNFENVKLISMNSKFVTFAPQMQEGQKFFPVSPRASAPVSGSETLKSTVGGCFPSLVARYWVDPKKSAAAVGRRRHQKSAGNGLPPKVLTRARPRTCFPCKQRSAHEIQRPRAPQPFVRYWGGSDIHHFLQKTVEMVSRHLTADVCSIYLHEENRNELVLTTTLGLNPGAVQRVRMRPGEGLVGATFERNQPVCEGVAGESPQFKYFPETDEDRFNSFIAVPIRRGIERVGVLVVQHEDRNYFDEIDVKALRAVASQLAGAIGNARLMVCLAHFDTSRYGDQAVAHPLFFKGKAASRGVVWGPAVVFDRSHSQLLDAEPSAAPAHTLIRAIRGAALHGAFLRQPSRLPAGKSP